FIRRPASTHVQLSYRTPDPKVMRPLQVAFVRETTVRVEYVKEAGDSTTRRLEPHALLISWPAWYLLAFDHLRREPRTFRFPRLRAVEIEEGATFRARPRQIMGDMLCHLGFTLDAV